MAEAAIAVENEKLQQALKLLKTKLDRSGSQAL